MMVVKLLFTSISKILCNLGFHSYGYITIVNSTNNYVPNDGLGAAFNFIFGHKKDLGHRTCLRCGTKQSMVRYNDQSWEIIP